MGMKVITVMSINIALVTVKIKGRLDAGGSDHYYGIFTVVRDRLKCWQINDRNGSDTLNY